MITKRPALAPLHCYGFLLNESGEMDFKCPICKGNAQLENGLSRGDHNWVDCRRCGGLFELSGTYCHIRQQHPDPLPKLSAVIRYIFEFGNTPSQINDFSADELTKQFPTSVTVRQERLLQAISRRGPNPGDVVNLEQNVDYPLAFASSRDGLFSSLKDMKISGLIEFQNLTRSITICSLTVQGAMKVEQSQYGNLNQTSSALYARSTMDRDDIVSIPDHRIVVQEIIDGRRTKCPYREGIKPNQYVEFFSASSIVAHNTVESYPEPNAIRVMVRATDITEETSGWRFFSWTCAAPFCFLGQTHTSDDEQLAVLDAVNRLVQDTAFYINESVIAKVVGLSRQDTADAMELLSRDGHLKLTQDTGGFSARLTATGRQLLKDQRRVVNLDQATLNSSDISSLVDNCSYQVILLIHGIRTHAEWQPMVRKLLEVPGRIKVYPIGYEFFDAIRFWLPFFWRQGPINHVKSEIRAALQMAAKHDPNAKLSIIAHSFGTYVIGKILQSDFDLKVHRLILCGSVLRPKFPWNQLQGRFDAKNTINECGKRDIWPVLAQCLSWGYGASGTHGFGTVQVRNRFHDGGHDQYLKAEFVSQYWEPFIRRGVLIESPYETKMPPSPYWMSLLGWIPIKWIVVLLLAYLVIWPQTMAYLRIPIPPEEPPLVDSNGSLKSREQAPRLPPREVLADDIDIASASFIDNNEDIIAPKLDLQLTNMGERPAFITKVRLNVKRCWRLKKPSNIPGVVIPIDRNYVMLLKSSGVPYQTELSISQGLKKDDFGRFSVEFGEMEGFSYHNTIYLVDVEIIVNSDHKSYKTKDMAFLISDYGNEFPDEVGLNRMGDAAKSLRQPFDISLVKSQLADNKRTLLEIDCIDAVRSPSLAKLIESAKASTIHETP